MTNEKYQHNILVEKCDGCNNKNLASRMARLRGQLFCDGCYRIREKEAISDWAIEYKRHMNGDGDRFKKILTAPKLSSFLN